MVRPRVTKAQFETDLSTGRFDVIHLVLYTKEWPTGISFDGAHTSNLKVGGLQQLIQRCGARMVCLATCHSTVLGSELSKVVTVIAGHGNTPAKTWLEWERTFYGQLALGTSVYDAFDLAQASSDWPLTLHRNSDAVFQIG